MFPVRKPSGISEDNDDQFYLVGLSKSPLVPDLGAWGPAVCAAWRAAWIGPPGGEAGRRLQCRVLRTSAVTSRLLVVFGFTFSDVIISGHAITSGDGGQPHCSDSTSNHSKWHC